ncbi:hypothetical protein PsorP6_005215 [Peronosclerospora sorghi]|uniref:Uncharacterized protein n=1 Tax=Peronosclerospora sorghi TaxID=230839 RepID=A0ACC0W2T1_9STRA|nr:hypothetical protein PsorP6_005215 [Peronosclerospora sorghi]
MFSFLGVRSVEAGMIELKTVRPLFYRLLPTYKATQDELPRQRAELKKKSASVCQEVFVPPRQTGRAKEARRERVHAPTFSATSGEG